MKPCTVLIIDDNPDDIVIFRRILFEFRPELTVESVSDGLLAIRYLEDEKQPGLIIIDLKLQETSGVEILQFIRNSKKTKYIPVIIFSTSDLDEDMRSAYDAGANSFLHKTHDYNEFEEILTSAVRYWLDYNQYPE